MTTNAKVLLVAMALSALAACAAMKPATEAIALQSKLGARYGDVRIGLATRDSIRTLELTLRDSRYHGRWTGFRDTAMSVARFAAQNLPADYHPDSITINIVTADLNLVVFRKSETSSATFAVSSLH